jgi:uncharacterized protein (TIGR03067 family)
MHWHLLTVVLVVAAPAEDKKKDAELIQGTWTVVSREFVGKKTPEAELKAMKVTIKDGTITVDDGKKKEKHAYKLDPSKTPKAIDLANTGIEEKVTTLAIYELNGDTLKICWSEKDPDHRATKFAGDEESGQTMIVLKREKKDAKKIQGTWAVVSWQEDGNKALLIEEPKLTIKGDTITFEIGKEKEKFTIELDETKKPKAIDFVRGKDGKELAPGIYELDEDNLKICYLDKGKDKKRPTEFTSESGSKTTLIVLKREKAKKDK